MKRFLPLLLVFLACVARADANEGMEADNAPDTDHSSAERPEAGRSFLQVVDANGKVVGQYRSSSVIIRFPGYWVEARLTLFAPDNGQGGAFSSGSLRFQGNPQGYATPDCSGPPIITSIIPGLRPANVVRTGTTATMYIGMRTFPAPPPSVNTFVGNTVALSDTGIFPGRCFTFDRPEPVIGVPLAETVVLTDLYTEPLHLQLTRAEEGRRR